MNDLKFLADKHRELDFLIETNKNGKPFISDWNCGHPFYEKDFKKLKIQSGKLSDYNYIRGEDDLTELISEFHYSNKEPKYLFDEILTSHGSTTIISAFFIWLKSQGVTEVYYIPPVYFTFHFFSNIYGVTFRPITKNHLYEKNPKLNLPNKKTILIVTDPIWYSGFPIKENVIDSLKIWQEKTKSIIFVDGSFQYFKWDSTKYEFTSKLNRERTFRLLCPSKSVAIHGFRFSYLLLPQELYNTFDFILDNLMGSSNPYDVEFAKKCMQLLSSKKSNRKLIEYTRNIFEDLKNRNLIFTEINPSSGYFIFARLIKKKSSFSAMDGKYFEQLKYKDYVRVNLLGSAINKLL